MIEDPRKQQMKALKGEMVRNIIISLLIAVVIFVGLSGLPLSGAPKVKQIASAQATFDGKTVEVSQQDMQIAADLAVCADGLVKPSRRCRAPISPIS